MAGKSDTILRRLLWTALLLTAGLSAAPAEPVYGQSDELRVQFELTGGSAWCDRTVIAQLRADNASVYQPEGAAFLRMIARIRAAMEGKCADLQRILFVGYAGQQKVFAAEMTQLTRWRRFISLDPRTEAPICPPASGNDIECGKRGAAYTTMKWLMTGPAFTDVELTSAMEDRTDVHAAWEATGAFGALKLSHRSENGGRYADSAAFAAANVEGIVEACTEDGGQTSRIPAENYGGGLAVRSVLCRRPGRPSRLNVVLVTSANDWFYLFSVWGEEPNTAAANSMATRLAQALAAIR